jgi:hypothetical protein
MTGFATGLKTVQPGAATLCYEITTDWRGCGVRGDPDRERSSFAMNHPPVGLLACVGIRSEPVVASLRDRR